MYLPPISTEPRNACRASKIEHLHGLLVYVKEGFPIGVTLGILVYIFLTGFLYFIILLPLSLSTIL